MRLNKKQEDFVRACGECGVNPTWAQVKRLGDKKQQDDGSDLFMREVYKTGGKK